MSLYISHPDIPAARIGVYPKRRRRNDIHLTGSVPPTPEGTDLQAHELRYEDFFATPTANAVAS